MLQMLAKADHRTLENTVGALIATGIGYFIDERGMEVRIAPCDANTDPEWASADCYRDIDIIAELEKIALIQ